MVKKLARQATHKLSYIMAACILLAAILMIAALVMTPMLDTRRHDIEQWASQVLQAPVTIDSVGLSWFQYQPVVKLKSVTLYAKEGKKPILQVRHIRLLFSIPQSFRQWKPVLGGLVLTGSELKVYEAGNKEYVVQGFPAIGGFEQKPFERESKFVDSVAWLSQQPLIILRDIDIRYTGFNGQKRFVTLNDLRVSNTADKHLISGKAILHQNLPTEVSVSVDWSGNPVSLNTIDANIYLYLSGLSLSQWLTDYDYKGWQLREGLGSIKLWGKWNDGNFKQLQTEFKLYNLNFYSKKQNIEYQVNRILGGAAWQQEKGDQVLAAKNLTIDLPHHLWPITNFYFVYHYSQKQGLNPKSLQVQYLDLSEVRKILTMAKDIVDTRQIAVLDRLEINGSLNKFDIKFADHWQDIAKSSIKTEFNNISVEPYQHFPGLTNLSGKLEWSHQKGRLDINSQYVALSEKEIFAEPLTMSQLEALLYIEQTGDAGWNFKLERVQLLNNDLAFNTSGKINVGKDKSPNLDLKGNLSLKRVNRLKFYLPIKVMSKGLASWLSQAFLAGAVDSANFSIHGSLDKFPFDHNEGVFTAGAKVKHIDLRYAPTWPLLKQIDADLTYQDRKISVNLKKAMMEDIVINEAFGIIPRLGLNEASILTVTTREISTDFAKAISFVNRSPLKNSIGKMLAPLSLQGDLGLVLSLNVPLSNPDKILVNGTMDIKNANLALQQWDLSVDNLIGKVNFTESALQADAMQANLFGEPLNLSLATIEKDKPKSRVQVSLLTQLSLARIEKWLKLSMSGYASGKTSVAGQVLLSLEKPVELHLTSDLEGVTLKFPGKYAKDAGQKREMNLFLLASKEPPIKLSLKYADLLSLALLLDKKNNQFSVQAANLSLGKDEAAWPKNDGLYISGHLDKLDLDELKSYGNGSSKTSFAGLKFKQLDVNLGTLDLFGIQLHNADLEVEPKGDGWAVGIDSKEVEGIIYLPKKMNQQSTLKAKFNKISIRSSQENEKHIGSDFNLKELPAFDLEVADFIYNDMRLGSVTLITEPGDLGQRIVKLNLSSPELTLSSSGMWADQSSSLKGVVNAKYLSDYLERIDSPVHNFIANKGSLDFDLSWAAPLYAPSLAKMSGTLKLDLGAGRIIEVGDDTDAKLGIGRMLSVFSLQSLPRRLSLDFSDLFQKGYSFDSLKGHFRLKNGNLYTSNMQFMAPVANVDISGRIGLVSKDLDITLGVLPMNMTSTLPVAAAYLTGPVGGVAAFALSSMLGSKISSAASHYYEIKGPWENPSWETIEVKKDPKPVSNLDVSQPQTGRVSHRY